MRMAERLDTSPLGERYRLLVEAVANYAIYMLDREGWITSWNRGAERFKGYSSSEVIGSHFSRFYIEEDRKAGLPARALETAEREGKFESEGWRVRKDGSRFWAHVVIDPIRAEDGTIIGFAKITRDISDRKEAQKALEQAREALFQSQKMDAIGQLTGGIAHDFNNLLTVILGSLELAGKRLPDDPRLQGLLANAVQAAQRGAALTQRMLAFARRQDLRFVPVDVAELVVSMTDLLRRSLGPSITIGTRFPTTLNSIRADANQLEMALLNLVVNARDAMPDGGSIVIEAQERMVSAEEAEHLHLKQGRYVCLSVKDTGVGMDRETLAHATEPFFTTKGIGRGTGLGLSMVHGMTEQSGGRFVLKSRRNKGTTAELWLPAVSAESLKRDGADHAVKEPCAMDHQRPLVVLAVDDDRLVRTNTAVMLQDMGHEVFEASSGKQALDILRGERPVDLVITDHAMPQMTGIQLAATIKQEWPHLPVILATGYAELPPGAGAGLPKLAKPFRQQELKRALAAALPS